MEVELYEPEGKGDVVGAVKAVPEGADHEHEQLVLAPAFEVVPLVNAPVQPLLNVDVPIAYLLPYVDARLHLYDVHRIYSAEVASVVAHSRRMDTRHAQLPPEVVFEPCQRG